MQQIKLIQILKILETNECVLIHNYRWIINGIGFSKNIIWWYIFYK